jgi:hypothetical protein
MQAEVAAAERVSLCNFLVFETPIKINDLSKMPQYNWGIFFVALTHVGNM